MCNIIIATSVRINRIPLVSFLFFFVRLFVFTGISIRHKKLKLKKKKRIEKRSTAFYCDFPISFVRTENFAYLETVLPTLFNKCTQWCSQNFGMLEGEPKPKNKNK